MPKVNRYAPGQAKAAVVGGPRASGPGVNYMPIAKGLNQVSKTADEVGDRLSKTSAQDALTKLVKSKDELLFTGKNPYFSTKGKNAVDSEAAAKKAMDSLKQQHGEGLSGPARRMFDLAADQHIKKGNTDISKHSLKGLDVWETANLDAEIQSGIDNGSRYWNDPKELLVQEKLLVESVHDRFKKEGLSEDAIDIQIKGYQSKFAQGAIYSAIAHKDPDRAEELLEKNRDNLGSDLATVTSKVSAASLDRDALNLSDRIMAGNEGLGLAELKGLVDKAAGKDTPLRKAARSYVQQSYSVMIEEEKVGKANRKEYYYSRILNANNPTERSKVVDEINSDKRLKGTEADSLLSKAMSGIKAPLISDEKKLQEVREKAVAGLLSVDDLKRDYQEFLSADDLKRESELIKNKGGARISGYMLRLNATLPNSISGSTKKKGIDAKVFVKKMDQFIDEYKANNSDKLPSDKELDEHKAWMLEKVVYDEDTATPDETIERFRIDALPDKKFDIPTKIRKQIDTQLEAEGTEVNDEERIKMYKEYLLFKGQ